MTGYPQSLESGPNAVAITLNDPNISSARAFSSKSKLPGKKMAKKQSVPAAGAPGALPIGGIEAQGIKKIAFYRALPRDKCVIQLV